MNESDVLKLLVFVEDVSDVLKLLVFVDEEGNVSVAPKVVLVATGGSGQLLQDRGHVTVMKQ